MYSMNRDAGLQQLNRAAVAHDVWMDRPTDTET
jgi:hypothetical protein